MDGHLKQRMVGAAVLIALCVIFIPILLDGSGSEQQYPHIPVAPPKPTLAEPLPLNTNEIALQEQRLVSDSGDEIKKLDDNVTAGVDTGDLSAWAVQLGSFKDEENAQELAQSLRTDGFSAFIEQLHSDSGVSHRVRIGPEMTRKRAEKIRDQLNKQHQLESVVMRYRGPEKQ